MKFLKYGICCGLILFSLTVRAGASENARRFISAVTAYQNGDFQAAVEDFSTLAGSGLENAELFYNLGNAYLKKGDLGHAVLWYERALKLDPTDPDLKFNLDYALSLTKDQKSESALSLSRIFFFWKYHLSADAIKSTAIVLNLIFWLFLLVGHLRQKQKLQRIAYVALVFAGLFAATALYNFYESSFRPQAVVLSPEVSIRSGLSDDATELFRLHAGTKIRIEKEQDDHVRIYFADGKIGWVKKDFVGRI
jgi:tetratricopeptide (TPR) repeat protein